MKPLARNGLWVGGGFAAKSLAGLLTGIILTRLLSPTDTGLYFLLFSIATSVALASQWGMNRSIVRFVGKAETEPQLAEAKTILLVTLGTIIASGLAILWLLSYGPASGILAAVFDAPQLENAGTAVGFWILALALRGIVSESFRGLHNIPMAVLTERIGPSILLVLALLITGSIAMINDFHDATILSAAVSGTILVLVSPVFLRHLSTLPPPGPFPFRNYVMSSLPLLGSQLASIVMSQSPLWILGSSSPESDVALFSTAFRVAILTSMPLLIVNNAIMPTVSRLYARGSKTELQSLLYITASVSSLGSGIVALILLLFPEEIMTFLFGEPYGSAAVTLRIIAAAAVLNVLSGSGAVLLSMSGHEHHVLRSIITATLLAVLLGLVVIPLYGHVGAAFTYTFNLVCYNALLVTYCRRKLGFKTYLSIDSIRHCFRYLKGHPGAS